MSVEPGQMYQHHCEPQDVYVIIQPHHRYRDGWLTFNITRSRYEWDSASQFRTQYRRLV